MLFMIDRSQPQGQDNLVPVPVLLDLGERYQPRPQSSCEAAQECDNDLWIYWTRSRLFRLRGFPLGETGMNGKGGAQFLKGKNRARFCGRSSFAFANRYSTGLVTLSPGPDSGGRFLESIVGFQHRRGNSPAASCSLARLTTTRRSRRVYWSLRANCEG